MIKAIIFDMDGVLVDSNLAWYNMFNKALYHFEAKTITESEFNKKVWAKNFHETAKEYFSVPREDIVDYFNESKTDFSSKVAAFSDVESTLDTLKKKGLKLCVATNTHCRLAKEILKKIDIYYYFDYIIGGDMVQNGKPEPDILIKTLNDLRLKKEDVIFIGDTIWDKIASEKANIKFIGLRLDATNRIEKFGDILNFLG
jgi:HAD superfamily hydrolase (TIGR01509 family)